MFDMHVRPIVATTPGTISFWVILTVAARQAFTEYGCGR